MGLVRNFLLLEDSMNKKIRHTNIPECYVLLRKNANVFLLQRFNTGFNDGLFGTIAGHVEKRESFSKAACREAFEEAGIIVKPSDLAVCHVAHRLSTDGSERVGVYFFADRWEGTPYNAEPSKCDRADWFDVNNLPENTIPYMKSVIQDAFRGAFYSEFDWE